MGSNLNFQFLCKRLECSMRIYKYTYRYTNCIRFIYIKEVENKNSIYCIWLGKKKEAESKISLNASLINRNLNIIFKFHYHFIFIYRNKNCFLFISIGCISSVRAGSLGDFNASLSTAFSVPMLSFLCPTRENLEETLKRHIYTKYFNSHYFH